MQLGESEKKILETLINSGVYKSESAAISSVIRLLAVKHVRVVAENLYLGGAYKLPSLIDELKSIGFNQAALFKIDRIYDELDERYHLSHQAEQVIHTAITNPKLGPQGIQKRIKNRHKTSVAPLYIKQVVQFIGAKDDYNRTEQAAFLQSIGVDNRKRLASCFLLMDDELNYSQSYSFFKNAKSLLGQSLQG
jgi:hypothetical protein